MNGKQPEEMTAGEHIGVLKTTYQDGDEHKPLSDALIWMLYGMAGRAKKDAFFSYEGPFGKIRAGGTAAAVAAIVVVVTVLLLDRYQVVKAPGAPVAHEVRVETVRTP